MHPAGDSRGRDIATVPDESYQQALDGQKDGRLAIIEPPAWANVGTSAYPAWGYVHFSNQPTTAKTLTIGDVTYEFRTSDTAATPGAVRVQVEDTLAETLETLADTVSENDPAVTAEKISDSTVAFRARNAEADGSGIALSTDDANGTVSGAALTNGDSVKVSPVRVIDYTVTAADVASGSVVIDTGSAGQNKRIIPFSSRAGVPIVTSGALDVSASGIVTVEIGEDGTGDDPTVALAAADVVRLLIFE